MTENINSEALDELFEIDGQLYGFSSLVRMARIRASILHASAAWGSSDDGALIGALADEVERLTPYVDAFRREERRADDLATEAEGLREVLREILNRGYVSEYIAEEREDYFAARAALGETE